MDLRLCIVLSGLCVWLLSGPYGCTHQADPVDTDVTPALRVLVVSDPFAHALRHIEPQVRNDISLRLEVVDYASLHTMLKRNATLAHSDFDMVSIDVLWLKELVEKGMLLDLTPYVPELVDDPEDFLSLAWQQCAFADQQWAIPIQAHAELLWVRDDLLATAGHKAPRTTSELLEVAAALHKPQAERYGIVWNALRGHPLGQSMAHFYAAFGADILDADGRPALNSPQGLRAAQFAIDLLAYSPPDILQIAWDERVARFTLGQAAMTYGWSARSALLAPGGSNPLADHVSYHPAPHAPGHEPVTPLGTWALAIPAHISQERKQHALRGLSQLSAASTQRFMIAAGMAASPRRSLLKEDALRLQHPVFAVIEHLDANQGLGSDMRPAVPQGPQLSLILGTVFHDMLQDLLTPEEALAEVQRQAEVLWEQQ